jgi:hypothetical protein
MRWGGGQQQCPLGLALQQFSWGCEGLVIIIVIIAIDSPSLLAPSALPCPFALPLHLLPLLFLPFIIPVDSHFKVHRGSATKFQKGDRNWYDI